MSCTDPSINFLIVFIFSGSIQMFTFLIVLVSYSLVLFTILKKEVCRRCEEDLLYLWCPSAICLFILCASSLHVCAPWICTSRWSGYDGLSILHCHNSFVKSNYLQLERYESHRFTDKNVKKKWVDIILINVLFSLKQQNFTGEMLWHAD